MSFLSAIGGLVGSLFGGGNRQPAAPQAAVSPIDMSPEAVQNDAALISFWEGVMRDAGGGQQQKTTAFDPVSALMGQQRQKGAAPMAQTYNQRGGQAHPGYYGQGLFDEKAMGPGRGGGDGLRQKWPGGATTTAGTTAKTGITPTVGGGTTEKSPDAVSDKIQKLPASSDSNAYWRALLGSMNVQNNQVSNAMGPQFSAYMGQALSGRAGLPEEAYRQAVLSGQQTINAQSQASREQLMENMGARGLLRSGMMARGLRGVEEARQGSIGDLLTGLAQQNMQARVEAQRQAAGLFPAVVGAESNRFANLARTFLGERQLELEKQRLGMQQDAYDDQQDNALWSALGTIAGAFIGGGPGAQAGSAIGGAIGGGSGGNMQGMQPFIF